MENIKYHILAGETWREREDLAEAEYPLAAIERNQLAAAGKNVAWPIGFRFIEFNPTRNLRGAEAARVAVVQNDGQEHWLWMAVSDIRANIIEHGEHPELLNALAAYGQSLRAEDHGEQVIDCPALHKRSSSYPFGNKVPKRLKMLRTVTADPMPAIGFALREGKPPQVAINGMELNAWTNSHGAVCAVFPDGEQLGLRPNEFEVIQWHELDAQN